jgi:signal transduction histidine kinase
MDIYTRKSYWKWYLAAAGVVIIIITLLFTRYLAEQLSKEEEAKADQFAQALENITLMGEDTLLNNCDLTLHSKILQENTTIPVVVLDESNRIEDSRNIGFDDADNPMDTAKIRIILNKMIASGADTIHIENTHFKKNIIYTHSKLLDLLKLYPIVQLCLIIAFVLLGYVLFSSARKAEQNQIWVGLAKETAHQLGTPISAIIGWIENLQEVNENNSDNQEMLNELRSDVTRLELIADRFSKIGSLPDLTPVNIYQQLQESKDYMQRRSPRKIVFEFPEVDDNDPLIVNINAHLFDWVIENLLRNAIDAIDNGIGCISAYVYQEIGYVCVDISDTGKGIPTDQYTKVFKPGFTTKKRGWGLGLSLSERIVEEYHGGRIFVKSSEINKGTIFTIKLPIGNARSK